MANPTLPGDAELSEFIRLLHRALHDREPDEEGLRRQVGAIRSGRNLPDLVRDIAGAGNGGSAHRPDGLSDAASDVVFALYREFLGRDPEPEGLANYVREIGEARPFGDILRTFANSGEHLAKKRREVFAEWSRGRPNAAIDAGDGSLAGWAEQDGDDLFPPGYDPPGEAGKAYEDRRRSGFLTRYCSGPLVLDVGYTGYDNPEGKTAVPHAIGIDLDYPGYDGVRLPFEDETVDTVFSSHCLEHILFDHAAIRDWHRVLRVGGFIVCSVPSQALYEKRRLLPSDFNDDHKRMYTPSSLAAAFETALDVNTYRVRHLGENDSEFDYARGPGEHSVGRYEIEIVVQKIQRPLWTLT